MFPFWSGWAEEDGTITPWSLIEVTNGPVEVDL